MKFINKIMLRFLCSLVPLLIILFLVGGDNKLTDNCQGNGELNNGACRCFPGFDGPNCSLRMLCNFKF